MSKYIITTKEAKRIDQRTTKINSLSTLDLIKNAGKALFKAFQENCKINSNHLITILAGPGYNGADALMMGYLLIKESYQTSLIILEEKESLKIENLEILQELESIKANITYLNLDNLNNIKDIILKSDFLIDGIFGTGLNQEIKGLYKTVIEEANSSNFIFSIDIPSGLGGDNGVVYGAAIKADLTAIIQNYKVGNLINEASDYHGKRVLVNINLLEEDSKKYHLTLNDIKAQEKRKDYSHKYHYGNILIFGGSLAMTGAPIMAAIAALRSGAGIASIALPSECKGNFYQIYPEIITNLYNDINQVISLFSKRNAIAFGPGLGRNNPLSKQILSELIKLKIPLVIDADGIYYLKSYLNNNYILNDIIITPHLGELADLVGVSLKEAENKSLEIIEELARVHELNIVLKGPCTIICNKDETWFSDSGNPGMATAGSGDVLTGIITSLLAQGYSPLEAAKTGVYLHSLAGNLALLRYGEAGMIATDIIGHLPKACKMLQKR